jgi:hypothetical protein
MSKVRHLRLDEVTMFERATNGWVCHWQAPARKGISFVTDEQLFVLVDRGFVEVGDR